MKWYFEPRRSSVQPGNADDSALGLASIPTALLQRHGAVVLDPALAAAIPGWPVPQSTVYRARTLLVPDDLSAEPTLSVINRVLAEVGVSLLPGGARTRPAATSPASPREGLPTLPRRAWLIPATPAEDKAALPVVVDAWVALQALRAAATKGQHRSLDKAAVRRISLEHLLVGSAITGSPVSEGGGVSGVPVSEGGGVSGPGSADSYIYGGWDARTPVEVCIPAPDRDCGDAWISQVGRRPVIAVLDTGVREHAWLDVLKDSGAAGGYTTVLPDGFVAIDQPMQDTIRAQSQPPPAVSGAGQQSAGTPPAGQADPPITFAWDTPVTAQPLVGELDTHTGHGTFIAGIVRQVAPNAQVLAVRIMHSDGIVYEGDLMCALNLIAGRIEAALSGDMSQMVDVVSLSLGYFSETSADQTYGSGLWQVIESLLQMGVAVTAAAGNFSTSRRFYPAAFADLAPMPVQAPLISVGALNPDGSKALFSDGGTWIRAWASGAAMISTFPADINGSRDPEVRRPAHPANVLPDGLSLPPWRAALDQDDFTSGFAAWSGTSFAAPVLAAVLAAELLAQITPDNGLKLDVSGAAAAVQRLAQALQTLGWPG